MGCYCHSKSLNLRNNYEKFKAGFNNILRRMLAEAREFAPYKKRVYHFDNIQMYHNTCSTVLYVSLQVSRPFDGKKALNGPQGMPKQAFRHRIENIMSKHSRLENEWMT